MNGVSSLCCFDAALVLTHSVLSVCCCDKVRFCFMPLCGVLSGASASDVGWSWYSYTFTEKLYIHFFFGVSIQSLLLTSSVGGLLRLAHCPGGHFGHHAHALVLEQGRATDESRSRQVCRLRCLPQGPVLGRRVLHGRRLRMGQWGCDQCLSELVWLATHQQALLCSLHPEPVPHLLLQWHH
ncbi:unnamed protein product [Ixodes pacificus]